MHAPCAAIACRPAVCRPAPRLAAYAVLSARQSASAFDQPLTFDTSRVKDMSWMFYVRPQHAPCAADVCHPLVSRPTPRPLFLARQFARAFNQPLDFNTYSVTTMHAMFYVRSARSLPPISLYLRRS